MPETDDDTIKELRAIANEGYNQWLAMLPDDDWSEEYARAIPIHWDEKARCFVDGPTPKDP